MENRETSVEELPTSSTCVSMTIHDSSGMFAETTAIPRSTTELYSTERDNANHVGSIEPQQPLQPPLQTLLARGQLPTYKNQTETMIIQNHVDLSSIPIAIATNVWDMHDEETDIQNFDCERPSCDTGVDPNDCGLERHIQPRHTTNEIVSATSVSSVSSMNRRLDEQYRRMVVASYDGHALSRTDEQHGPDVTDAAATTVNDDNYNSIGVRDGGLTSGIDRGYIWCHSRRRRFAYLVVIVGAIVLSIVASAVTTESHRINRNTTTPVYHHPDNEEQSMMRMPNDDDSNFPLIGSAILYFYSAEELYNAVDEYVQLQLDNTMMDDSNVTLEALLTYRYGHPMNLWDVSRITNFSSVFDGQRNINLQYYFNENLSSWNVTNATIMFRMFAKLNTFVGYGLEQWDVGNVISMRSMFHDAYNFQGNVSHWDVSQVQSFDRMFSDAHLFNSNISLWDTSLAESMSSMFQWAQSFDQNISQWNVHRVQDFSKMFSKARNFNSDLSGWNTSSAIDMDEMFANAYMFNQDVSDWNVRRVVRFSQVFSGATHFNHSLCSWGEQMLQQKDAQNDISINVSGMFSVTSCLNTSDPILRTKASDTDIGPFCHSCI